jgi:hypothetical protein
MQTPKSGKEDKLENVLLLTSVRTFVQALSSQALSLKVVKTMLDNMDLFVAILMS